MTRSVATTALSFAFVACAAGCVDCGTYNVDGGVIDVPDGGASRAPVALNELLASNATVLQDEAGGYGDWIELANTSDEDVDLEGYAISDTRAEPRRFVFGTGVVVPAGGHLLVWADGDVVETSAEVHLPFKLAAEGEELLLVAPDGEVVDFVEWGPQTTDVSYGRVPDGTGAFRALVPPTPRAPNVVVEDAGPPPPSDAGFADAGCASARASLNEVLVRNETGLTDTSGSHEPWIEVRNDGDAPLRFSTLAVADDPAAGRQGPLPDQVVAPGAVLVVFADGVVERAPGHVALQVTPATDVLYLLDGCGAVIDVLDLPAVAEADVSVGHGPDGGTAAYATPTPGVPENGPVRPADAGAADAGDVVDAGSVDAGEADADGGADAGVADAG